ncbi:hypothetical protein AB5I41_20730 [Sphingomonas sp. MMS24-JH45]
MLAIAATLASCGGDGGGGGGAVTGGVAAPTPTPTAAAGCSLQARESWVFAQMSEWYLFPDTLLASFVPLAARGGQSDLDALQDYLRADRDRARAEQGSLFHLHRLDRRGKCLLRFPGQTAGFGMRLSYDTAARRLVVSEAFEGAPALAAGIDRGTEIVAIGTSGAVCARSPTSSRRAGRRRWRTRSGRRPRGRAACCGSPMPRAARAR